jgi:hypothetical protein
MSRTRFTDWLIKFWREDSATGALARSIREAMRADGTFPRDPQAEDEIRARQIGPSVAVLPEAWARWRKETGRDIPVPPPAGIPAVPIGYVGLPTRLPAAQPEGDFEPALPYEIPS